MLLLNFPLPGTFSQFSKFVCFTLKPRFSIYVFDLEDYSGNTEQTNFSRISFLWYLLPINFILFLFTVIIFIKLGNGNVDFFHTGMLVELISGLFTFILSVLMRS